MGGGLVVPALVADRLMLRPLPSPLLVLSTQFGSKVAATVI